MTAHPQIPLDLFWRPAMGAEDFLVAPSNRSAVAWIDRWPDWPAPALVVHGPPGCGKSHLLQVWRTRSAAALVRGRDLTVEGVPTLLDAPAVAVDDAREAAGDPARERAFFHLYNLARERGAKILLAADAPPARWGVSLPDLASRLNAAPSVAVEPPDDALLAALMVKLAADRHLGLPEETLGFLLPRVERSFDFARRLVAALDRASLAARRPATVPLARSVLAGMLEELE
ncbi:MAG TPA: DnaA/Hda family protein [Azospirillaceae bacterium]|nr:DnaA/Hda family protein [Azospirillaceae bacterium]